MTATEAELRTEADAISQRRPDAIRDLTYESQATELLRDARSLTDLYCRTLGWVESAAERGDMESVRVILAAYHRRRSEFEGWHYSTNYSTYFGKDMPEVYHQPCGTLWHATDVQAAKIRAEHVCRGAALFFARDTRRHGELRPPVKPLPRSWEPPPMDSSDYQASYSQWTEGGAR